MFIMALMLCYILMMFMYSLISLKYMLQGHFIVCLFFYMYFFYVHDELLCCFLSMFCIIDNFLLRYTGSGNSFSFLCGCSMFDLIVDRGEYMTLESISGPVTLLGYKDPDLITMLTLKGGMVHAKNCLTVPGLLHYWLLCMTTVISMYANIVLNCAMLQIIICLFLVGVLLSLILTVKLNNMWLFFFKFWLACFALWGLYCSFMVSYTALLQCLAQGMFCSWGGEDFLETMGVTYYLFFGMMVRSFMCNYVFMGNVGVCTLYPILFGILLLLVLYFLSYLVYASLLLHIKSIFLYRFFSVLNILFVFSFFFYCYYCIMFVYFLCDSMYGLYAMLFSVLQMSNPVGWFLFGFGGCSLSFMCCWFFSKVLLFVWLGKNIFFFSDFLLADWVVVHKPICSSYMINFYMYKSSMGGLRKKSYDSVFVPFMVNIHILYMWDFLLIKIQVFWDWFKNYVKRVFSLDWNDIFKYWD